MNIDKLIGNTPMIKIKFKYQNRITNIYAKLEYYNYIMKGCTLRNCAAFILIFSTLPNTPDTPMSLR